MNTYPWLDTEDRFLSEMIQKFGEERQWKIIAEKLNTATFEKSAYRQPKQCRERWFNHLNPTINRGEWSTEEDVIIMRAFLEHGKKWSLIAKSIGNRTENAVKNRWLSLIKKLKSGNPLLSNFGRSDINIDQTLATEFLNESSDHNLIRASTKNSDSNESSNYQDSGNLAAIRTNRHSSEHRVCARPLKSDCYSELLNSSRKPIPDSINQSQHEYAAPPSQLSTTFPCSNQGEYDLCINKYDHAILQNREDIVAQADYLIEYLENNRLLVPNSNAYGHFYCNQHPQNDYLLSGAQNYHYRTANQNSSYNNSARKFSMQVPNSEGQDFNTYKLFFDSLANNSQIKKHNAPEMYHAMADPIKDQIYIMDHNNEKNAVQQSAPSSQTWGRNITSSNFHHNS